MDYYPDEHPNRVTCTIDNSTSSAVSILDTVMSNKGMHLLSETNNQMDEGYEEVVFCSDSIKQECEDVSVSDKSYGNRETCCKEIKTEIQISVDANEDERCLVCAKEFQRPSSVTNHMKIHNHTPLREFRKQCIKEEIYDSELIEQWTNDQFINSVDNANMFSFSVNVTDHIIDNIALEVDVNTTTCEGLVKESPVLDQDEPVQNIRIKHISQDSQNQVKLDKTHDDVLDKISDKRPHICKLCGLRFNRLKALMSHERLHQTTFRSFECSNCEDAFPDKTSLKKHYISCSLIKQSHLNNMSKSFQNVSNSSKDCATTLVSIEQDISILDKTEVRPEKVTLLTKASKQIKHHACPDCPKRFATKQKMFRHMWIHRKKTFTCEICARAFAQQHELDEHRLSQHSGGSPYLCQECGKCFASRQGLWEHGRIHNPSGNAGQFHCAECDKQFASRQGFLIHTRTHTGERPYGCRYCWKAFRDGGTLRKHERIHTGERPHLCPLCPRAFNQKVVLREHIRWVHAANKLEHLDAIFQCKLCNEILSDREELCAHIVKHSDQIAAESKASKTHDSRSKAKYAQNSKTSKIGKGKKISIPSLPRESQFGECVLNFPCDLCGLRFGTREMLRGHVKVHI